MPVEIVSNRPRGDRGPLAARRVIVTRARHQAAALCRQLEERGAEAIPMPTIAIVAPPEPERIHAALSQVGSYQRLILTSANAVQVLEGALSTLGSGASALEGVRVCAIGPGTSRALAALGIKPELVAREYRAEGLLDQLPEHVVRGERILLLRARDARELLPDTLRQRGAVVDVVAAYVTTLPEPELWAAGLAALRGREVDAITLTSASTARNLVQIIGDEVGQLLDNVVVAAIGPISAQAAVDAGLRVDVVPPRHTVEALVEALAQHYTNNQGSDQTPS